MLGLNACLLRFASLTLLSFLQVKDVSNKGKIPPLILTKMNTDLFESEMESESDLEECGFGGIRITDKVLAFARNIEMHPKMWLDFPIDEEEDLDRMCVFFFFFSLSSSLDSNQQPKSQCLNFLRKKTKIIYIIGL